MAIGWKLKYCLFTLGCSVQDLNLDFRYLHKDSLSFNSLKLVLMTAYVLSITQCQTVIWSFKRRYACVLVFVGMRGEVEKGILISSGCGPLRWVERMIWEHSYDRSLYFRPRWAGRNKGKTESLEAKEVEVCRLFYTGLWFPSKRGLVIETCRE